MPDPTPAALTAAHRAAQLQIKAEMVEQLAELWPQVDWWGDPAAAYSVWFEAATELLELTRVESIDTTVQYLTMHRAASGIAGAPPIVKAPALPDAVRLERSLRYTALRSITAAQERGADRVVAMQDAFTHSSGTLTRNALDGGRETLTETMRRDPRVTGWTRTTGSGACKFCQDVAGYARVYRASLPNFETHDHCGCSGEPSYE